MAEGGPATHQSLLLLEYNGMPKVKVTVASNISLTELKELAAEKFSISQPVTLEYFDKDFDEWVAVDDTYQLPSKGKLRVSILQVPEGVAEPPKWVPYCTEPVPEDQGSQNSVPRPKGAKGGFAKTDKIWQKRDVLKVYFLNPEDLDTKEWMCGKDNMNVQNIVDWAQVWNNATYPHIPSFEKTDSKDKADIRVHFGGGGCWSKVGMDAKSVKEKSEPTMNLDLNGPKLYPDLQKYLVIHEFGHSLGLEHEHQRSDFWSVVADFVDMEKMRRDPNLENVDIEKDWLKLRVEDGESTSETESYDPDSVMHYWFDVRWLKEKKHWTLDGVKGDDKLSPKEKIILEGIHKRNKSIPVDGPSVEDQKFLEKCYAPSEANPPTREIGVNKTVANFDGLSSDEVLKLVDDKTILNVDDDSGFVLTYLNEVAGHWEAISRNLHVKASKIGELNNSRQTAPVCLGQAITDWLQLNYNHQKFGKPTWRKVAESVVKLNNGLFLRIAWDHKV